MRRVTAIRAALGERLAVFVGVDDLIVEGVAAGRGGLDRRARQRAAARSRCVSSISPRPAGTPRRAPSTSGSCRCCASTSVPKFVQLIKLVQQECGMGSERVRPPRLVLEGAERGEALAVIRERLARRPGV